MDPITAFATVVIIGMNVEITNIKEQLTATQDRVLVLEDDIADLNDKHLTLAGKHAAHRAASITEDARHDREINSLREMLANLSAKIDFVDQKVQTLHP